MNTEEKNKLLKDIYYDPLHGFNGVDALFRKVKKQGISRKEVAEFLKKQEIVQRTRKQFKSFNSFVATAPLQEMQIDLIYLENPHLNQAKYCLTAIDIFSKKATAIPLKRKTGAETADAFKEVLKQLGVPKLIYSDQGSEFKNKHFEKVLDDNEIKTEWEVNKAPFIERWNQNLKKRLYKYLNSHPKLKTWINVLPQIVKNYNNTIHNTTGVKPDDVNDAIQDWVLFQISKKAKFGRKYGKLEIGDKVRLQLSYDFKKGYQPKWTKELHTVTKIEGQKVYVDDGDEYYVRSEVLPVKGDVEVNPKEADLQGTREGHLKSLAKRTVVKGKKPEPAVKATTRNKANRLPVNFYAK